MIDPIRRLLTEAGKAKQTRAFWQAATDVLSEWTGARVELTYKGLNDSGALHAGAALPESGEPFLADFHDADGRHVSVRLRGLPKGFPAEALHSTIEIASHLAVMVARRSGLERERRLGTFLVELSRWLLAAPTASCCCSTRSRASRAWWRPRAPMWRCAAPTAPRSGSSRRWASAWSSRGARSPSTPAPPAVWSAQARRCSPTTSSPSRTRSSPFRRPGPRARR